mgnify:CR=1 FL=1
MCRLKSGEVVLPEILPAGIDEDYIADGAILTCIGFAKGSVDIDLFPPLWGAEMETGLQIAIVVNIVGISIAVWFLRSRLLAKLAEVEERQARKRDD